MTNTTSHPTREPGAAEGERAIRDALAAGPTPCEWSAMAKPSASYSDCGWRAVAMCGAKWMVGAPSRVMLAEGGWNNEANAALMAACNPDAMRSLLAEIDRLRASQSDGTSGGWISVDERLPAHEQEVICSGFEGNDPAKKRWQEFAVFHRDGLFYNRETGDDYYPPTHWREMPALPAAPTQGENHVG